MEINLNETAIKNYSRSFSKKVLDQHFENRKDITGEQILSLTPVNQVNLLVIKNLFQAWKTNMEAAKSPYFDYDDRSVQEALTAYMNALSRHIRIDREYFTPLLEKSVEEALLLVFSPYQFFKNAWETSDRAITWQQLNEVEKYIKINHNIFDALMNALKNKEGEKVSSDQFESFIGEVLQQVEDGPENTEPYQQQFNQVQSLQPDEFFHEQKETPVNQPNQETISEKRSVNELFDQPAPLHEKLQQNDTKSLAELHEKKRLESIRKNITINQRYMFVNELFKGNSDEFNAVIEQLDQLPNKQEALSFLQRYEQNHHWNKEAEEVQEFFEIVEKKFS